MVPNWRNDVEVGVFLKWKLSQAANKQLLVQQQMQLQQQKQLELELRQARGGVGGVGGGGGGSSADSIREVVNAAISLEFQRQRDRYYNSRQVGLGSFCQSQPTPSYHY